jgi:hypothetical protein
MKSRVKVVDLQVLELHSSSGCLESLKHQATKSQIVILGILAYISRAASGSSILPHDIGLAGVAEPFPGLALLMYHPLTYTNR